MRGFVDLQVNGYAGADFNSDDVSREQVAMACQRMRDDGVAEALATIITAPVDLMCQRIARIVSYAREVDAIGDTITGIHIEGPFISNQKGYVGAHPAESVRKADQSAMDHLLEAGGGMVRMVTLAPEMDESASLTRWLSRQGIIVAAGHSDATLEQLRQSIDAGLQLFTHLGNGCPALLPRHDNIIQRVLRCCDHLMISLIADGHHIPPMTLFNYLRFIPEDRVIIVTDAISAAGLGPGQYQLGDQTVEVDQAGAAWSADKTHFAGSAATMPVMREVLTQQVGIAEATADRWMVTNPAALLHAI